MSVSDTDETYIDPIQHVRSTDRIRIFRVTICAEQSVSAIAVTNRMSTGEGRDSV